MEHHSLYRGSVRGTRAEGSHNADTDRCVIEGSGKSAFILYGSIGPYKVNVQVKRRHFAREGSASHFIGPEPVLDYSYSLEGLFPYFWSQHTKGCFSLGSGKLDPDIIRETYPRSIMAFIKDVGFG